jgi:hypothetical protein
MRKLVSTYKNPLLLALLLFVAGRGFSQGISLTTNTTPSICYNDGTLIINASGGTAPYIDSILSGPTNPNLTYPIALPVGQDTFTDLPHGSFTIVVHDAGGHSGTFTDSVGGTYEFPAMTFGSSSSSGIICTASGGLTPLQYAISSTGSNIGFGPYQSSDTFANVCPGLYWLRVRDSCDNIYTGNINYNYSISFSLSCINFSKGTMTAIGTGGHPPYTYTFGTATNHTGIFTGLQSYFSGTLTITDSCGVNTTENLSPPIVQLFENCPFDSIIYLNQSSAPALTTYTFICTNCSPVQTVNGSQLTTDDTLFRHANPNQNYNIIILSPACGGDTLHYHITPPQPSPLAIVYLTCNSVQATSPLSIDSFALDSSGIIIQVNGTGYFSHIPNGIYTIEPYGNSSNNVCVASHSFSTPYFGIYICNSLELDSSCQFKWGVLSLETSALLDQWTLISSVPDTFTSTSDGYGSSIYFTGLNPGTYTLTSDSGCSLPFTLGPFPTNISTSASSSTPCTGDPIISCSINVPNPCHDQLTAELFLNGNWIASSSAGSANGTTWTDNFTVSDSGWYHIRWYIAYTDQPFSIDNICPLDSSVVYVSLSHFPFPYVQTSYWCNGFSTDTPTITIYGGEIPYTIEIPGIDTITMNTNTAVFPTYIDGTYNVIAYDNCGISRSFTFTIYDTCSYCGAVNAGQDTTICSGQNVHLIASPQYEGGSYLWEPGGATTQSITVSPHDTTIYIVTYTSVGCSPVKDSVKVSVIQPSSALSIYETSLCGGSVVRLTASPSQTGGNYLWTPGDDTTQSILVSNDTISYSITYTIPGCSFEQFNIGTISLVSPPSVTVFPLSSTSICAGAQSILIADVAGNSDVFGGSYFWSPGGDTTQTDTVSPATSTVYYATYSIPGCTLQSNSVYISVSPIPFVSVRDTSICAGRSAVLTATPLTSGGTYIWSPGGATTQSITVSPISDTTYSVVYSRAGCSSIPDSGHVYVSSVPTVSVRDTSICTGESAILIAIPSDNGGNYLWSPGGYITQSITVSPVISTIYSVTYFFGGCTSMGDSARITVYPIFNTTLFDSICVGDSIIFTGQTYRLSGNYYDTLQSIHGCDSIVTLHLAFYPTYRDSGNYSLCQGQSINVFGNTITTSGFYSDTLQSIHGCDSILTLHLIVKPLSYDTIAQSICTGDSFTFGGSAHYTSGYYSQTLTGRNGCDSIVTLHLTMKPLSYDTIAQSVCSGDSFTFGGSAHYTSGYYSQTLTNRNGCDSILTLDLTVKPFSYDTIAQSVCLGDSFIFGGFAHYTSGYFSQTFTGSDGCDSLATLHLTVNTATPVTLYDTICQGASVIVGSHHYSQTGSYIDTLTGSHGCDSIVNLSLTVFSISLINLYDTICSGNSVTFGSNTYSQSGIYFDTLMTLHGCDSISALNLIVLAFTFPSVNISVSQGPVVAGMQIDTFTAIDIDCVRPYYSWYENNSPLGIHSRIAIVPYPQGANENIQCNINCHTECEVAQSVYSNSIHTGISNIISFIQGVKIYPNPTQGSFTMDISASNSTNKDAQILITDLLGQPVLSKPVILHSGNNKEVISMGENTSSGIYIVQLTVDGQSIYYRIVLDK